MINFGVSAQTIVPLRKKPSDKSELTSQILYGECFEILRREENWSQIKTAYDNYVGWIDNKQINCIEKKIYLEYNAQNEIFCNDLVNFIVDEKKNKQTVVLGSILNLTAHLNHKFEGKCTNSKSAKNNIIKTSMRYLNSPYLWGGKTPFGIDCSGFTQMVYRINGLKLKRDASQQAKQGKEIKLIKNSKAGDLAFFKNSKDVITHVGIILEKNQIIHAHGKVRIDKLTSKGIYNVIEKKISHNLATIKSHF